MNFATFQAHPVLIWVLFLLPLCIVMWRGYVIDWRAERRGEQSNYGPLVLLGFVPVLNIPVSLLCLWRLWQERARGNYYVSAR